jgi:hypothetical protein
VIFLVGYDGISDDVSNGINIIYGIVTDVCWIAIVRYPMSAT